jgi:hypothetical protein
MYDREAQTCQSESGTANLFALSTVEIIPTRVISDAWFLDLNEIAVPTI